MNIVVIKVPRLGTVFIAGAIVAQPEKHTTELTVVRKSFIVKAKETIPPTPTFTSRVALKLWEVVCTVTLTPAPRTRAISVVISITMRNGAIIAICPAR